MPWCATIDFPHPLVNIKQSNAEIGLTNYLSYGLADMLTWQGLGDVINKFRTRTLGLQGLSVRSGPGVVERLRIPWTYTFSPRLVPKPDDWKNHIDVVGFYFLDLAKSFQPPEDLKTFLENGPPPMYIGFGSVVVEDAAEMTRTIFDAVKRAGVRALVSAGWGGLGGTSVPPNVFILDNVPHDWLFTRVSAVCHHGGAGTTAIGLRLGKPTIIVPFFGDQPFWGAMVKKAGAGPKPIPIEKLNAERLAEAIKFAMTPQAQAAAERVGQQIQSEDGVSEGVKSFHRHLPILNMRCDLDPSRLAVWWWNEQCLKISAFAAQVLVDAKELNMDKLELHRSKEYDARAHATDPLTGGTVEILRTVTHFYSSIAQIFYNPVKGIVNTTVAIPRGVVNILDSVHEGMHNAPRLYGSDVREPGKVFDFSSGIREGGKALFYGYYDGIMGLWREPYRGAKSEGVLGAVKGSARSFVNVHMRPAAGILGLITHPMRGGIKSMQLAGGRTRDRDQRLAREWEGKQAVERSTKAERKALLSSFRQAKPAAKERRQTLETVARKIMEEGVVDGGVLVTDREGQSSSPQPTSPQPSSPQAAEETRPPGLDASPSTSQAHLIDSSPTREDSQFERDLDMAIQLSLAEQRGYERGLAEARSKMNETQNS